MTIYTTSILPMIQQSFDSVLLSYPHPKLREDSEDLINVFNYIKSMSKHMRGCIGKQNKFNDLEKQFLEIYERIKEKEEERKAEKNHFTQRPFYFITSPDKYSNHIFKRFKYRKYAAT